VRQRTSILFIAVIAAFSCRQKEATDFSPDGQISYNYQIRPILSDKCLTCHGPDARNRKVNLRLDKEEIAFKALKDNPDKHVLVAGHPTQSELYLRISATDTSMIMPPQNSGLALTEDEKELIRLWIKQGAKYEKHWAFVAPKKSALPPVDNEEWCTNEIDHFVLSGMQRYKLEPNQQAEKEHLLKRVSFDLTGLPPSVEMMDEFLKDDRDDAFEKIVDKLMAVPQYGEHMAVHWLDVARFADSHGYQDDNYRSQWPWRDWVIHAFNSNLSYDKFVTWQLAGDQLPDATKEQILATGFNRNHKITEEGGVIDEEYRVEYVVDRTSTFAKAFLGVTLECARCHDHKYDPFSQKEFYQTYAFFNSVEEKGLESTVGGPETFAKNPRMQISDDDIKNILTFINKKEPETLEVSVMKDSIHPRKTFILGRGVYDNPTSEVSPSTPASILPFDSAGLSPNRLGLSKWLFDKRNPLTARVFVNRMWQEIFGRGLVKTSGDFGMQGELPSHPELLDWLSVDFVEHQWDIKRLMKQIVISSTYRQSSVISKEKLAVDPENIYLARGPRFRMTAEMTRDLVLASSGLLSREIGGPSVKPYQPLGLWETATSGRGMLSAYVQDQGDKLYRRSMYTFIKRTVVPPSMAIFDASNRDQCEVKRVRTNTPLQALVMLNDPQVLEASRVFAARLLQTQSDEEVKLNEAFRKIVCRMPTEAELSKLKGFLTEQRTHFKSMPANAEKLLKVGEYPRPEKISSIEMSAWMQLVHLIYNL
jgi:hypothetical protein